MGVEFKGTVERMIEAGKLKNHSDLARVLGITPQAISNYKKRGEIPADLVIKFAKVYGVSVDYLLGFSPLGPYLLGRKETPL